MEDKNMELRDLEELIKTRRSIRVWQDREVPEQLLMQAIELATWAPNGGNRQNWHFYIVQNKETIKALRDAVQSSADLMASWPEARKFGDAAATWKQKVGFFGTAPAVIAVATFQYQSTADLLLAARGEDDPQARIAREWRNSADSRIQSVSAAVAYLLLVLHQMGLGAVWMTGPIQAKGELEKILKVPAGRDLMALIPVGYPAEQPSPKKLKPVREVVDVIR
jgi:nitroreductase